VESEEDKPMQQRQTEQLIPITFTYTELFAISAAITRYQAFLAQTQGNYKEAIELLEHFQQNMIERVARDQEGEKEREEYYG
jgi:hypothetical protein